MTRTAADSISAETRKKSTWRHHICTAAVTAQLSVQLLCSKDKKLGAAKNTQFQVDVLHFTCYAVAAACTPYCVLRTRYGTMFLGRRDGRLPNGRQPPKVSQTPLYFVVWKFCRTRPWDCSNPLAPYVLHTIKRCLHAPKEVPSGPRKRRKRL